MDPFDNERAAAAARRIAARRNNKPAAVFARQVAGWLRPVALYGIEPNAERTLARVTVYTDRFLVYVLEAPKRTTRPQRYAEIIRRALATPNIAAAYASSLAPAGAVEVVPDGDGMRSSAECDPSAGDARRLGSTLARLDDLAETLEREAAELRGDERG